MIDNTNISAVIRILRQETRNRPLPSVEKISQDYGTPWHILVSTMLSARTKDENTSRVSAALFQQAENNNQLLKIKEKTLQKIIFASGFYKNKARSLKKMSLRLKNEFHNKVPDTLEALISLPGVGRKTANLTLINAFNKYGICVDTHVHRIVNRWGYVQENTPDRTELALRQKLPKKHWKIINFLLVIYGKSICRPVRPLCPACGLALYCPYPKAQKKSRQ